MDADGKLPESLGDAPQVLIRVRVTANKEGAVTLVAGAMQRPSEETTVFGSSAALQERQIKRTPLALVIGEPELAVSLPMWMETEAFMQSMRCV